MQYKDFLFTEQVNKLIKEYIKDNLTINVGYYDENSVEVELLLDDEVISSSRCLI